MGVLVLGMHRSGTSALTRVLNLLGLDVGEEDALVEATDANPVGHWEVEALSRFDEDVLVELGGKWSAPPAVEPAGLARLAEGPRGAEGAELLAASLGTGWVWKDPRLCLLLPFWRRLVDEPLAAVVVLRDPAEVARSLRTRNGIPLPYGLALWERHLRRAVLDAADLPTAVVDYERALAAPREVWDLLDGFLVSAGVDRPSPPASFERAQRFLDPSLRRERSDEGAELPTPSQRALRARLDELVGAHPAGLTPDLPDETPGLQLAFDEHARMAEFENVADRQRNGIEELLEQCDKYLADNRTLQEWLASSRDETATAWSEVRRLEDAHRDAVETQDRVMDYLEQVIADRDRLRGVVDPLRRFPPTRAVLAMARRLTR